MNSTEPLSETPYSVTLSRADFDALLEALEDVEDRMSVLKHRLLDGKREHDRRLLLMADTMRIIYGGGLMTV